MAAAFQAFAVESVLDTFQKKIEALECVQEGLLAGLTDGTLVLLRPDAREATAPWQVSQAYRSLCKKGSTQLQVWKSRSLLLLIAEEGLNAYHFPGIKLACQAGRSRGVHKFALDEQRNMLCLAVRKRLLLYHHSGNEFVELKDFSLPDTAVALQWVGDSICVGFKREYVLVHANTGAITEMFSVGKANGPCLISLTKSELLVVKDNVAVIVGPDGRPSRKAGIAWSDIPLAMTISRPYAIALLPTYIEVRANQRDSNHALAQVLPLRDMGLIAPTLAADGSVFVAAVGDAGIRRLLPTPFSQQAKALSDAQEFTEALSIAALMPSEQANQQTELIDSLHLRFGHHLFAQGDFEGAFSHFALCSYANPVILLRLFPSLSSQAMLDPLMSSVQGVDLPDMAEPSGSERDQAIAAVLPYLMSHRSRLAALQANPTQAASSEPEATGPSQDAVDTSELAAIGLAQDLWPAAACAVDTAIVKAMLAMSDTGALLRFVQRPHAIDLDEGSAALQSAGRYSEQIALLQNQGLHEGALALLQTLAQHPESLEVPPQGAAVELKGVTGAWAAVRYLVSLSSPDPDLIKHHARWILQVDAEAALEMFMQMQPPMEPSLVIPVLSAQAQSLTAAYLETALNKGIASPATYHLELAHIYLRLALHHDNTNAADPKVESPSSRSATYVSSHQAAERLNNLALHSEYIDPHKLLNLLPANELPHLRAVLLERLGRHQEALRIYVHVLHDSRLAEAYCDRLYDAAADVQRRRSHSTASASSSTAGSRPSSAQPAKALSGQWAGLDEDPSFRMYIALIQVYLESDRPHQKNGARSSEPNSAAWGEVARLLSRKHDRIDPLQALAMLPDQVSLKAVLPFLEGALRAAGEKQRNAAVVKSLRRSENLHVREELTRCKQRSIMVTFERACHLCHKRIGNAAFVAYPEGGLAHYSCFKRDASRSSGTLDHHRSTAPPVFDISG